MPLDAVQPHGRRSDRAGELEATAAMNYADRCFHRDLVHSMAKALAHGLITESEYEMRRWAKRCEQIADFAVTIYGEHTTRALLDQAREESWVLARRYV